MMQGRASVAANMATLRIFATKQRTKSVKIQKQI